VINPEQRLDLTHCFDYYMLFIHTSHSPLSLENFTAQAKNCSQVLGLDYDVLNTCANNDEGLRLIEIAEQATIPFKHKYVPWIAIDGTHSTVAEHDVDSFVQTVCDAYKGTVTLPSICLKKGSADDSEEVMVLERAGHCAN